MRNIFSHKTFGSIIKKIDRRVFFLKVLKKYIDFKYWSRTCQMSLHDTVAK